MPHSSHRTACSGRALLVAACLFAILAIASTSADASSSFHSFCAGNRASHGHCYGPEKRPLFDENKSTNGGWSWVWVWNERYGADASECRVGNCTAQAALEGEAKGQEEMENTAGGTYYFTPEWYGE